MDTFGKSQSTTRVEDIRFLTGGGRYVDDIAPKAALFGYVFRSPVAHATIGDLNVNAARQATGVKMVLTAADVRDLGVELNMGASLIDNRDGTKGAAPARPFLATDTVRFVGEPVAFIVAETLSQARDAAELIDLDYTDLPVKVDVEPGGQTLHSEARDNIAFDYGLGDEAATDAAFRAAAHTVSLRIDDNRVIANSMEPRGAYAEWENDRLHVCFNGQGVWGLKGDLAKAFSLPPEQVRVTNPDVGGGFGMKAFTYPEYLMVATAAKALGKPVRWMGERTESMLSDNAGRDLVSTAELAFDDDYKITAYRIKSLCNMGAYNSSFAQFIQTELFAKVLMGVYDVQTTWMNAIGIYTNTTQVDAYRGAGRPEAIFALERVIDYAARELGVDPWELRRRNFIAADKFPYTSATNETYDVGDFHRVLASAEQHADRAGFAARRAESQAAGKLRGLGLCYYIESILGNPSETATVEFQDDGTVLIFVGTQSNGQGHETVYAKFLSDQTGIPFEAISVIQGDSDRIAKGGGTGGSRSVTVQNNATLYTVRKIITDFSAFLAEEYDTSEIEFDDERFRIPGRNETPTMLEVAAMARAKGRSDLLRQTETQTLPARSFPNGAHVAEVEIDPDTGVVSIAKYTVVDDFGNLINPMLAEGQVHGGVAQGIGQAITERVVYDAEGQLLTATFMDYGMPRADDLPMIAFSTEPVPSTANIMGMKGCGEAGTVGALAAVSNAVLDAVWDRGIRQIDMPFTPMRVWATLNQSAQIAAE
ncbi:xanthine dehydrogenase family protein molybdopterin-binding subunit [Oceaniglobus ichthyenteri]|uniref:xanthine dehydrogenase family protein molybdopterin-binding subunit n=1 Tax=Oceaniglobus ichthyenteri TaxID=2136177 RepID=UPI000D34E78D|nr:xanthine dehydrogenase family protein molybdopterin-binding subunit [Oceaniglobus ichthyenteri]